MLPLRPLDPAGAAGARDRRGCAALDRLQRFVLLKLLTGEFRLGVSQTLVVRALRGDRVARTTAIAARLMGDWTPDGRVVHVLIVAARRSDDDRSRPYPFFLAAPLEDEPASLGDRSSEWQVEWKWDGIRAQLDPAGRAGASVVARRRADHAPLPGDRRGRGRAAGRHRARRRGARLPRRPAAALLRAATAHRAAEAGRSRWRATSRSCS